MPYIEKRGNTYTFNRRAPLPLKPGFEVELSDRVARVGKNGYVRFTLGTSDRREAATKARAYAHLLDVAAERLSKARLARTRTTPDSDQPPTAGEIQRAALAMRASLLAADEQSMRESVAAVLANGPIEREPDRDLVATFDLPPNTASGQAELLRRLGQVICFYIYQTSRKTIESVGPEHLPFAEEFRRFVADMEARSRNEPVAAPVIPEPVINWSWKDALDYYFQQSELGDKTRLIYRQAWMSLAESAKVLPKDLKHEHVLEWRDQVLRKSVADVTAKNRLGHATAIWHASRLARKIPRDTVDPFEDIVVKVSKNRSTSRTQFTYEEMQVLFSAAPPTTTSAVSVHAGYWLPLMAAYYGGRLEELAGIEIADLVDTQVGLAFWIRPNSTRTIKGGEKASRCLPVHPILSELGFIDYLQTARKAGTKRLFPSLSRGATFGELFVEHCRNLLKPAQDRKVGMHCFRHSWETAKRAAEPNFDYSIGRYITGRSIDKGSAALYGSAAGLPKTKSELAKIQYGLKHRPAPPVTAQMLREQEAASTKNLRAGINRRKK